MVKDLAVKFLKAKVVHKRIYPHNFFCYKAGYIILPLIGEIQKSKLLAIDSFSIFSFHNKDHANRDGTSTLAWVHEKLETIGIAKSDISQVMLMTHPRCLNFVFNPVSFYFCLNEKEQPIAIISEVNNTFGQTHSYIIHEDDLSPIIQNKVYKAQKEFFVSPFFEREGYYEFRFSYLPKNIAVFINYLKNNAIAFETSVAGKIVDFTPSNALPYVFTTFKTVALTIFQAFILKFRKKLKFRKPPPQLKNSTTVNIK